MENVGEAGGLLAKFLFVSTMLVFAAGNIGVFQSLTQHG